MPARIAGPFRLEFAFMQLRQGQEVVLNREDWFESTGPAKVILALLAVIAELLQLQERNRTHVTFDIASVVGGLLVDSVEGVALVADIGVIYGHDVERLLGVETGLKHGQTVVGLFVLLFGEDLGVAALALLEGKWTFLQVGLHLMAL